jgi:hypothetical protein
MQKIQIYTETIEKEWEKYVEEVLRKEGISFYPLNWSFGDPNAPRIDLEDIIKIGSSSIEEDEQKLYWHQYKAIRDFYNTRLINVFKPEELSERREKKMRKKCYDLKHILLLLYLLLLIITFFNVSLKNYMMFLILLFNFLFVIFWTVSVPGYYFGEITNYMFKFSILLLVGQLFQIQQNECQNRYTECGLGAMFFILAVFLNILALTICSIYEMDPNELLKYRRIDEKPTHKEVVKRACIFPNPAVYDFEEEIETLYNFKIFFIFMHFFLILLQIFGTEVLINNEIKFHA